MKKILVVEDEAALADLIGINLKDLGEVAVADNGVDGLEKAQSEEFDLIILDLMLPRLDGLEVCRRLRKSSSYVPILMLTSKSSELDRVLGLEVGADDYLTKPFSVPELIARAKAIFRRVEAFSTAAQDEPASRLLAGDLEIDIPKRHVLLGGRPVRLTAKEFDLLVQFARHPGRVYTRADLLDLVWGYGNGGYEHTVNSHINRLRQKIEEDPAEPRYILTVWGVGYKLAEPGRTQVS